MTYRGNKKGFFSISIKQCRGYPIITRTYSLSDSMLLLYRREANWTCKHLFHQQPTRSLAVYSLPENNHAIFKFLKHFLIFSDSAGSNLIRQTVNDETFPIIVLSYSSATCNFKNITSNRFRHKHPAKRAKLNLWRFLYHSSSIHQKLRIRF